MDDAKAFGLVVALTEIIKQAFSLSGNWARGLGVLIGLIAGVSYRASLAFPVDYAGWFNAVTYGLLLGIGAVGSYEVVDRFVAKAGARAPVAPSPETPKD